MKIGELSQRTGVSVRMLRYYEAQGLLAPARSETGYRDFTPDDADTVERIRLLGAAGMTLAIIRRILPCSLNQRHAFEPCDELKAELRRQIGSIDDQNRKLAESRELLTDLLSEFEASTL
ncbi:MerR family transcriptional regulator [Amorphus orientalis]|uniref:DNA-binding transcriptional MerR regulator n=1 Tax=Amorphus orientalis TaxID=649198 RepID=A0AAE4AT77_9HYPH|nr:MerR family transcriptional regulator [Amorphus orientalis]MDQ0315882.1 DNA-binding transcriptional MerR regulator [Amorphus orientalis]